MNEDFKFWMRQAWIQGWAASRYRGNVNHSLSDIGERAAMSSFERWWKANHE